DRRSGSSARANGRAPSIPSSARSPTAYAAVAASSEQKANRTAPRRSASSQPIPANADASSPTRSQALRMLRATAPRTPPRSAFVVLVVGTVVLAVELLEPARRPVRLGRVAAARAVEARHVLERHEDVPVQLDVRDVLDRAVRGERALLVLPPEERQLDLLTLVLVGVVLHGGERSQVRRVARPHVGRW